MRRLRTPLIIALIVLAILAAMVIWWASRRLAPGVTDLDAYIDAQLEQELNREVEVGSARIVSRSRIVITGLRVAQGDSFDDGTLFTARRVIADVDLLRVLTGRGSVLGNISGVTFVDPSLVLIRDRAGEWNIRDLLERPPGPPADRFDGIVRIENGQLTVRDFASLLRAQPAVNTIASMNGSLDFRPNDAVRIDLRGRGVQERIGEISLRGPLAQGAPELTDIRARVTGADAGYWLDYFSTIRSWTLRGGTLNGDAVITQAADERLVVRGTATVADGVITSRYLVVPLTQLSARTSFVGTDITIDASARLRESPLNVRGTIAADDTLDLLVTSDRLDPLTLQQAVRDLPTAPNSRWPTPMSLRARVFGTTDEPRVRATASIPSAVVYGQPTTNITASATYSDRVIRISDLRAELAQGTGRFTAVVRLATGRTTVNGTLNNVRIEQLPILSGVRVTGITDATISLDWLRGIRSGNVVAQVRSGRVSDFSFNRADLRASFTGLRSADGVVQFTGGSLANVPVRSTRANLALRGNVITVSQGVVETARGIIRTSGMVTTAGALNLAVNATGVDLQALLGPLGYEEATGIASFDGRLTGSIASPLLTGTLTARNGRLQQITFDFLRARITATPQYVLLTDATIIQEGATVATTGVVRIARGAAPQFDLRVISRRMNVSQLIRLIGLPIEASGIADVDLRITGAPPNLRFSGTVAVTDAVIAGFDVDSARITLRTVDGRTVIDQLVATRDSMRLIGSGSIGPQGQLSIAFRGENLDLNLLNRALSPYVVLSGPMDVTGTVAGTLSRPTLRGDLTASTPTVNQVPFDRLTGGLRWDGTTLSLVDASLTREDVLYRIPYLRLNTRLDAAALATTLTNARLERVLELLRNSPYLQTPEGEALRDALATIPPNTAGDINAALNLSGPIGDISGSGSVTGTNIVLGPQQIESLNLGFVAQRSVLRLSELGIRSPGVDMEASAQFVAGEPTSLSADIRDTQIAPLLMLIENLPFLPVFEFGESLVATAQSIPRPVSGTMDASVLVTNVQSGPTGTVNVVVSDLILEEQEIGTFTADARLIDGTPFVERFELTGPLTTASLQGSIGPDQMVSLTGRAEDLSLSLLGPLVGAPDLSGTLDIDLRVSGPLGSPTVMASLTAIDVSTDGVSFQSVVVPSLVIQQGSLDAPQIIATTGRGEILVSASLPFTWGIPMIPRDEPIDVQITIPTQDLAELPQFMPMVQSASGTLTVNVAVSGTIADPETSGSLVIRDGALNAQRFNNDFTDLQVDATFTGSTLQINRFTGASSLGGTFEVTGAVELPSLNRAVIDATFAADSLRLSFDNLTGVYEEEIAMTVTGLLSITESLRTPLIAGDLVVSDALIEVPAGEFPTPGLPPGMIGPNPRFDVTLNLASNVWIERGPIEVQVVGPVSIAGTLTQPDIVGTVALTDGSLRYPGRTFTLAPGGSATFVWQAPEPPSIAVDLRMTTRVLAPSPFFTRFARYTIFLDISGTIDNLVINVSSSPPGLTETEALALIFRQAEIEALLTGVTLSEIVQRQLAETLLGLALPGIFEGIELGPFTIGLEPGIAVPLQAWISLQITDQLAFSYLRTLISGDPYDILELSYLISPQYAFSFQIQDNEEALYLLQAGWRF